ncbi:curli assembly protein CsgF, partial [Pseudomonas aeruginosa]|uniref:curli assembly protein CsgF n=2 Tax=Pseudomonas TaxID=286 RepID=UPI001D02AFBF
MNAHAWKALPLLCTLGVTPAMATELVYAPVNPSFGGNPLNGTYLLNNATAQDRHKDPDLRSSASSQSPL